MTEHPDRSTATLTAAGISMTFDPLGGTLASFTVTDEGTAVAPLHRVPWGPDAPPPGAAPHQGWLRGDFLAAPFGRPDPHLHGAAANDLWQLLSNDGHTLRALLPASLQGATVLKELSVEDGHPFVYQRHLFIGGAGSLPVANHAMVSVPQGAKLSFSRKRWFETPATALEPDPALGRSRLAYPRRTEDPAEFPAADGSTVNLTRYPWGDAHEDFVAAVEDPASTLGWIAVVRPAEGDLFLSLRNPAQLPMTMLWHSNGGRDYAPWNGRHRGCLGVEEGAALPMLGLSAAETPDPLTATGQPGLLTFLPTGTVEVRHIIGAIRWPSGQSVAGVMLDGDTLTVTGDWGAERRLPLRGGWLGLAGPKGAANSPAPSPPRSDWDI